MDSQRNILLIALALVSFVLLQRWRSEQSLSSKNTDQIQEDTQPALSSDLDTLRPTTIMAKRALDSIVTASTDVLRIKIDTVGGDIISTELRKYHKALGSEAPFTLLEDKKGHQFFAQSGLIGAQGIDSSKKRPAYHVAQNTFSLPPNKEELVIPLTYQANGITYTKTFILKRNSYAIDLKYHIDNQSGQSAEVGMYAHLRQTLLEPTGSLTMPTYLGGAFSTEKNRYKKLSFKDMKKKNLDKKLVDGKAWVAMIQHYFAAAWIPRNAPGTRLFSRIVAHHSGDLGIQEPNKRIASGKTADFDATLWVGPKLQKQMASTAPNLDLVVDYGWLWFIAKPLHSLLSLLQSFIGNWGFSIVCLTFIVRGAMYPLTKAQYTSMAKMRMLQPKIQDMKERIGGDRQRMSQEMMALYKKAKVNPLGGCFPTLLQMPIFISLYWALMESVELRHAPFLGWITDLSAQDPYFILPVLMGLSMFLIQKMSPSSTMDPVQQKIMMFMPVAFSLFFFFFPSGLVLYYLVSNIVTLAQQSLINRSLNKQGLLKATI